MAIPKLALIPASQGTSLYSVLPSNGAGDFAFTRAGSATRINSQGLIETVASGVSRLNYPLIDGVVNGCPSHLLEQSRTQKIQYSESFSNAYWTKTGSSVVSGFASPSADSPLGAFKLVEDASTGEHRIVTTAFVVSNGTAHSQSYFVKYLNTQWIQINRGQEGVGYLNFDLINGVVGFTGGITNYKISVMSNGWYRISINYTVTGTYATAGISILKTNVNARYETYLGNGTSGVYIYAAQFEAGSYPTSYIPNYGAAGGVTRSAETANGAGDASTFNDSEGVLFTEISALANDLNIEGISVSDGSISNRVVIFKWNVSNTIKVRVGSNGINYVNEDLTLSDVTDVIKIAVKYKQNDFSIFINGFELFSENTGLTPIGLDSLQFNSDGLGGAPFYGNTKQIQYFDSALTDSELETLTSWVSFQDMANGQTYSIK